MLAHFHTMPELPEVEVTRRGVASRVAGKRLDALVVRTHKLRYEVDADLPQRLAGLQLTAVHRRGKYLLFDFGAGHLLVHLGMSGALRFVAAAAPPQRHDHADLCFGDIRLRFSDPRRFGAMLWLHGDPLQHPLLARLGVEPLSRQFTAAWLRQALAGRRAPIKQVIMDAGLLVGVGNIYAAESLFTAGIDPRTSAARIAPLRLQRLTRAIRSTLAAAIRAGGSSLRDYSAADGVLGRFQLHHKVYGRAGEACPGCGAKIRRIRQGGRSTFYCPRCQR